MIEINFIHLSDCIKGMKQLDSGSVNTVVTSPPYWALRDYKVNGQIGLEATPRIYINKMVKVFREIRRVLNDNGTVWLNIGDSYASKQKDRTKEQASAKSKLNGGLLSQEQNLKQQSKIVADLKEKDLVGIPWMLAFALRKDGWYLRQDIIWHKPNPMPESAIDRCTKSHEYIFLLSKSPRYYYDAKAIATPYANKTYTTFGSETKRFGNGDGSGLIASENWKDVVRKPKQWKTPAAWETGKGSHGSINKEGITPVAERNTIDVDTENGVANKRSVWTVATKSFKEAHFATFPEELIVDCIKAGCPEGGLVLDPFMGAGTTALVSQKLNRNFIGFELKQEYIDIANHRLNKELGLFSPSNKSHENRKN